MTPDELTSETTKLGPSVEPFGVRLAPRLPPLDGGATRGRIGFTVPGIAGIVARQPEDD